MTFDTAGNLYVGNLDGSGSVIKIDSTGTVITLNYITNIQEPLYITNNINNDLWIIRGLLVNGFIAKYSTANNLSGTVIADPYISIAGTSLAGGCFDINNNFYFSDIENRTLYTTAGGVRNICFKEGSQLLCFLDEKEVYVPIEKITPGTLVKTSLDGYKPVVLIGSSKRFNPGNRLNSMDRLYICKKGAYPELTEDLILTGAHCILVNTLTAEQREQTNKLAGRIYVTDRKYRLMACIDSRAEPYDVEGMYSLWHLALEHEDRYMNYGVYANGLLVETASKRMMAELSGMKLVQS